MNLTSSPTPTDNCFLVPKLIFGNTVMQHPSVDVYLHQTKSIILDFYNMFENDVERVVNVKNRHEMIVKVLIEHLNLSLTVCGDSQYPPPPLRHIDFALTRYDQQKEKLGNATLFHSREFYQVTFAAVKTIDVSVLFASLIRPIGWSVFLSSIGLLLVLSLFISVYYKLRGSKIITQFLTVTYFLLRAHIDQCANRRRTTTLLNHHFDLKLIYGTYLFYCILIIATYKSNLVQELMQPSATISANTFEELVLDNKPLISLGFDRGGQATDLKEFMTMEATRNPVFVKLVKKRTRGAEHLDPVFIIKGKVNIIDDGTVLTALITMLERKFQITHFRMGKSVVVNPEFWGIKRSRHEDGVVKTLRQLASSGVLDHFKYVFNIYLQIHN